MVFDQGFGVDARSPPRPPNGAHGGASHLYPPPAEYHETGIMRLGRMQALREERPYSRRVGVGDDVSGDGRLGRSERLWNLTTLNMGLGGKRDFVYFCTKCKYKEAI